MLHFRCFDRVLSTPFIDVSQNKSFSFAEHISIVSSDLLLCNCRQKWKKTYFLVYLLSYFIIARTETIWVKLQAYNIKDIYQVLVFVILYYTILYDTIIYCTILYYTILYFTVLYYTILYYTILHCTILYYTISYCTILYYIKVYYAILYYTILNYTILYYTILYYTIIYRTILYYTILYYIVLYYALVLFVICIAILQFGYMLSWIRLPAVRFFLLISSKFCIRKDVLEKNYLVYKVYRSLFNNNDFFPSKALYIKQ